MVDAVEGSLQTPNRSSPQRRWWSLLLLIAMVAFSLRLLVLYARSPVTLEGDETQYHSLAVYFAEHREFRHGERLDDVFLKARPGEITAYRSPVLPVITAAHRWIWGPSVVYPLVTMCLLGAATCLFVGLVGRTCRVPTAGLVAAALWAIWPPAVVGEYSAARLLPETLGVFFLMAHVWMLLEGLKRHAVKWLLGAGLALGMAVFTRGYLAILLPMIGLLVLLRMGRRGFGLTVTFAVAAGLIPASWMLRNWTQVGAPVLSTQTEAFYLGNNAWARGSFSGDVFALQGQAPQMKAISDKYPGVWDSSEVQRSRIWTKEAFNSLAEDPKRAVWLMARKVAIFWSPLQYWAFHQYRHHWALVLALLAMPFGAIIFRTRGESLALLVFAIIVGEVLLATLLTYALDRYRYPAEPLMVLLASVGVVHGREWLRSRGRTKDLVEGSRRSEVAA